MPCVNAVIVDYGLGNIFSIQRAVTHLGADPVISSDHETILGADRLILPGVGSFGGGMQGLRAKGLVDVINAYVETGKPMLGICLGMQLLMSRSEEFGEHEGLNLIPGDVIRFPSPVPRGLQYKIPHVGWNSIEPVTGRAFGNWEGTNLSDNQPGDFVYFVHSYRVIPKDRVYVLAETEYGGHRFCSVVVKDNICGCQFHPELSGEVGLKIYDQFLK